VPPGQAFEPLMTLYLTETTEAEDLRQGWEAGLVTAVKLYPAGATTNSDAGVRNLTVLDPVFETMAELGMPLLIHGEVVDPEIDIFDREAVFIERELRPLRQRHPGLKVVFEHITTAEAVAYVESEGPNLAATITAHHLRLNRNDLLVGGMRPHHFCLPVAKREAHRLALRRAATGGNPKFFLGTDSAPHLVSDKESACGCAGIFSAPVALESYATTFEEDGALDRLEAFASEFGPRFYGLPLNEGTVTLERTEDPVPVTWATPLGDVRIYHGGEVLPWRLVGDAG
jgi:dihydroorotase